MGLKGNYIATNKKVSSNANMRKDITQRLKYTKFLLFHNIFAWIKGVCFNFGPSGKCAFLMLKLGPFAFDLTLNCTFCPFLVPTPKFILFSGLERHYYDSLYYTCTFLLLLLFSKHFFYAHLIYLSPLYFDFLIGLGKCLG